MLGSAKVMPEAKYSFKPVDTVRTFGQILAHVAGANYEFCAAARGEKSPFAEDAFEKSATTAAAIAKALQDSIAYCDAAYAALDDSKAAEIDRRSVRRRQGGARRRADGEHRSQQRALRQSGDVSADQRPGSAVVSSHVRPGRLTAVSPDSPMTSRSRVALNSSALRASGSSPRAGHAVRLRTRS